MVGRAYHAVLIGHPRGVDLDEALEALDPGDPDYKLKARMISGRRSFRAAAYARFHPEDERAAWVAELFAWCWPRASSGA